MAVSFEDIPDEYAECERILVVVHCFSNECLYTVFSAFQNLGPNHQVNYNTLRLVFSKLLPQS